MALISMDNRIEKKHPDTFDWIFNKMKSLYEKDQDISFDDMIGYIGAFGRWSIFKARPTKKESKKAKYILFEHQTKKELHLGLQFLLTGILSVYYDKSRTNISRPGFTAFPSGRDHDRFLGVITSKIPAFVSE